MAAISFDPHTPSIPHILSCGWTKHGSPEHNVCAAGTTAIVCSAGVAASSTVRITDFKYSFGPVWVLFAPMYGNISALDIKPRRPDPGWWWGQQSKGSRQVILLQTVISPRDTFKGLAIDDRKRYITVCFNGCRPSTRRH